MAKMKPSAMPETRRLTVPDEKPTLRHIGGGSNDAWNGRLLATALGYALPGATERSTDADEKIIGAVTALADMKPADPTEGMLLAQMVAANTAALELYRRAWLPEQTFEARTRFLALADKAARTVATLAESLTKYRTRGRQTVVVQHVNVADGGQAVVAGEIGSSRSAN